MNQTDFINELQNRIGYTHEQCIIINDVLESHFIFRKKNKPNIIADFMKQLSIDEKEAADLYEQSMNLIRSEIKTAKRHPFGDPSKR